MGDTRQEPAAGRDLSESLQETSEDLDALVELIAAHVRNLSQQITEPMNPETIRAEVEILNDIISSFQSRGELLSKLFDERAVETKPDQIFTTLRNQRLHLQELRKRSADLRSHAQSIREDSERLFLKAHEQISRISPLARPKKLNHLLASLPEAEYGLLRPHLREVSLARKETLYVAGDVIEYVYFPNDSVISKLLFVENGTPVDIGLVNHRGMLGVVLFADIPEAVYYVKVQVAGSAIRMRVDRFKELLAQCKTLDFLLRRYLLVLLTQADQLIACNRFHSLDQRLVRWLLMLHDCVRKDRFFVTHEVMAEALGVHRPAISLASHQLQHSGLIHYRRGYLEILDRKRLEEASCECYRIITKTFDWITPPEKAYFQQLQGLEASRAY